MAQIENYLKRKYEESGLNYEAYYFELYNFINNVDLRKYLAAFHTHLNKWFTVLNNDLRNTVNEEGEVIYSGGYFHAQDSRDYLALLDELDTIRNRVDATGYAFRFCNDEYDNTIRRTRRFVVKSGGSSIPEGFKPIKIDDMNPIFTMAKSVSIKTETQTIYANLKSVGEGSYAKVFSYIDPTYKIPIVLKRAKTDLDNKELKRFRQEFDVLKMLKSPYIIEVYAYNEEKSEYTMECMDESVYDYIRKNNDRLSLGKRKNIISQICC